MELQVCKPTCIEWFVADTTSAKHSHAKADALQASGYGSSSVIASAVNGHLQ